MRSAHPQSPDSRIGFGALVKLLTQPTVQTLKLDTLVLLC